MKVRALFFAIAATVAVAAAAPATAAIAIKTSLGDWTAAVGAVTTHDFDGQQAPGLGVSSGNGFVDVVNGPYWSDVLDPGLLLGSTVSTTKWTFPATYGFLGDWDLKPMGPGTGISFLVDGTPLNVLLGVTLAEASILNSGEGYVGYFGFVSTTPFTTVEVVAGPQPEFTETYNLYSLYFGDAIAAVPEPSTWALMLVGFVGAGFVGWRQSRKDAALRAA